MRMDMDIDNPVMYLEICGRKFLMKFNSYDNLVNDTHMVEFIVFHPDGEEWIRFEQQIHNQLFEDVKLDEYLAIIKRNFLCYIMRNSDLIG